MAPVRNIRQSEPAAPQGKRWIALSTGQFTLVDEEDFEYLQKFNWLQSDDGSVYRTNGGSKRLKMHRDIVKPPPGYEVDHKNHNRLDNTRENLRLATKNQNGMNRRLQSNNRSGFKGISQHVGGLWKAEILVAKNRMYLGYFHTPEEAARAYDDAARKHYGEFACLNFPLPGERSAR